MKGLLILLGYFIGSGGVGSMECGEPFGQSLITILVGMILMSCGFVLINKEDE